jgi:hypothetical protein
MTTPRLKMPELSQAQAGKEQTHNAALTILDALVGPAVVSRTLTAPPGSPADGALYIPAAGASGAWSGKAQQIAQWINGLWRFHVPWEGLEVWSIADAARYRYAAGAWAASAGQGDLRSDGTVAMAAPFEMGGYQLRQAVLRNTREVEVVQAAASGALNLDLAAGNVHRLDLVGNVTLSFTNAPAAGVALALTVVLEQDATGGRLVTWPITVRWPGGTPPTLSAAANSIDVVALLRIGGDWLGVTAALGL